jgi:hypothetical protein
MLCAVTVNVLHLGMIRLNLDALLLLMLLLPGLISLWRCWLDVCRPKLQGHCLLSLSRHALAWAFIGSALPVGGCHHLPLLLLLLCQELLPYNLQQVHRVAWVVHLQQLLPQHATLRQPSCQGS